MIGFGVCITTGMTGRDFRHLILLAVPAGAAFAVLAAFGHVSVNIAIVGALFAFGGLYLAARRIKSEMDAVAEADARVDESLREEFVRQARLAESYEVILDSLPEPLLVLRADRHILHANKAVVDLLGTDPIDADLTTAIRHPDILSAAAAVLSGESEEETVEFSRAGAVEQHLVARLAVLPSSREIGRAAVLTLHDVTSERRTVQMRADFVANVSHELRTPLATLVGFIETLRGAARDDPEALDKFLPIMDEEGSRMAGLVQDLLSLSRIEANEHSPPSENARLQDILPVVARTLEREAEKKGVVVIVEADPEAPAVFGDRHQLMQVFQNLIHNAVKYGREQSEVRVVIDGWDREYLTASVIDQGEGIPPEHIPRLTERFYRVDKARSRAMGGTGLGLAIVKHIVNRHQGRLWIESSLGVGSRFSVSLPVVVDAGDEMATEYQNPAIAS